MIIGRNNMNIKKILCPIDFSKFSDTANKWASEIAKTSGAEITYLNVAPQGAYNGDYGYAMERTREEVLSRLVAIEPTIDGVKHNHDVAVCILVADAIIEYADANQIDLIVIPTHGRTGFRRLVMGSVAEAVLRRANCPVVTVRPESSFFEELASDRSTESVPVVESKERVS